MCVAEREPRDKNTEPARDAGRSIKRHHEEAVQATLLFLVLLAAFFWRSIFLGQKLVPADIIYSDPVYAAQAPSGFTEANNTLLYDQTYQFYPWRVYSARSLRQGTLPLWNPYIYCGAPFLAADQPAVLYPLNILTYVLSAADAALATALARLLIAGLTTYWFLRTIGAGRFGGLLGGLSYALGGFMIVFLGHPHTNVAAWLPALFLSLEWLYRKVNARHVAILALVTAVQLTGGHAELCLYTLTAGALYYLFRVVSAWWGERRQLSPAVVSWKPAALHILSFGAAMILGFALASVHVLPFVQWLRQNAELDLRLATKGAQATHVGLRHWLAGLPLAILPNLFGNPTWPGVARSFLTFWNFAEQTLYVGIIALALAAGEVIFSRGRDSPADGRGEGSARQRRTLVVFMSALALVALGAALRWPVFDWLNQLPLFSIAAPGRLRMIYTFAVSVLAGLGASRLSEGDAAGPFTRRARVLVIGLAALGVAVLGLMRWALDNVLAGNILGIFNEAIAAQGLSAGAVQWAFGLTNLRMYWPVLLALAAFVVLTLYCRRVVNRRVMQILVLLLAVVDLFAFGMNYHTTVRQEEIFPETPALTLLQSDQGLFRVVGTSVDFMPNSCMMYGLQDVRGLDFPDRRYLQLCQAIGGQDRLGYGIVFTEQLQPRLLGLMNVKYVLTSSELDEQAVSHLTLLAVDKDVRIYQNRSFLPRSFIVHRVRIAGDAPEALEVLRAADLDLGAEIVLEEAPPPGLQAGVQAVGQDRAAITRYEASHVTIDANSSANGFLFVSDRYDPGWKAYVDGVEARLYRADYVFRAVYLTAGQHTVDLVYEPRSFAQAVPISLVAALALVALLGNTWLQKLWARDSVPPHRAEERVSNDTP